MLRPLPYAHPDRLVRIYTDTPPFKFRFSVADYLAFTEQQTRFERHATYTDRAVSFSNGEVAELLRTRVVSWAVLLGARHQPAAGPRFQRAGRTRRQRRQSRWRATRSGNSVLGGRADAIGKPVRLDGADVHDRRRAAAGRGSARAPLRSVPDPAVHAADAARARSSIRSIARLPEGADRGLAADELRAINRALFPIWKPSYQDEKATWSDGGSQDEPGRRRPRDCRPLARARSRSSG